MSKVLSFDLERDDLCDRLGGGIPKGSLVVVQGGHGSGKSLLVQRIVAGLMSNDHSSCYVTTELTTRGFLLQMESLGFAIEEPIFNEQLVVVPAHPMIGGRAPRHELLTRIAKARLMYSKDVVIFDAFSKFLADHVRASNDETQSRQQIDGVLHLFKRLTSTGRTVILTMEDGQVSDDIVDTFVEAADVYLQMDCEVIGSSTNRRLVVRRMMRAADRFSEIINFRVEPRIGIVVEIRSVV